MAAFKGFGMIMLNWLRAAMFNLASVNVVVCSCVQVFMCLSVVRFGAEKIARIAGDKIHKLRDKSAINDPGFPELFHFLASCFRILLANWSQTKNSPPFPRKGQRREASSERRRGGRDDCTHKTTSDFLAERFENLSPPCKRRRILKKSNSSAVSFSAKRPNMQVVLRLVKPGFFKYLPRKWFLTENTQTPEHFNTVTLEHPNTGTLKQLIILATLLLSFAVSAQSKILSPHGPLKWECESCHTPRSFYKIKNPPDFDHKETGFLLLGKHEFAPCAGCHKDLILSRVASACADCHNDVHRGQFGFDCQNCHSSDSWENNRNILGIHASRGFALVGVHAITDCQACHIDEQRNEFTLTPTECATCHIGDYLATSNPNHIASGFGLDCRSCHVLLAVSWEYLNFFETQANLKLNGAAPRRVLLDRIRKAE